MPKKAAPSTSKHVVIDARIRRSSTGRPVDRLLQYLQTLDSPYRFTVLVEPDDPWEPSDPRFSKQTVPYPQYSFNPRQQWAYARDLRKAQPDVVFFTQTGQQPLFYFGQQITFTHDLTMLRFARAGRLPGWLHALRMLGYRLLFWAGNKKASHIIVPTRFVAEDLAQAYHFAQSKTTVIYEASEPHLSAKPEQIANIKQPFIFHVGSPFPHKNLDRLVGAFELLQQKHPDLTLVLSGKREFYFDKLERTVVHDSPAAKKLIITGFVKDSELRWLYEKAACYVLPSLSEGFGLPGLEAMAHGTPLASSNATCLPELYGHAALYFDPRSITDMAEKIDHLITNKALQNELRARGLQQVKKYSWLHMTEQMLDVIDDSLKD